jgi:ankyrin repeat protein
MHDCYDEVEYRLSEISSADIQSQAATYGIEYAVALPCDDVVKLLLEHKADPNVGLSHACERGHQTTVEILIAAKATACTCGRSIAEHNPEYGKKRKRESQDEAMREFNEKWAKILDKQKI